MDIDAITAPHTHTNRCWWDPAEARWICRDTGTDVGGTDTDNSAESIGCSAERPLVDVRDMLVVHTAMLREFRLAPAAVARTQPGDRKRAQTVGSHLRFVCEMLHHHHAGEDELLWPKLLERTPCSARGEIERAEGQHVAIDASLTLATELRETWLHDPSAGHRDRLCSELERLYAVLAEHLELEERALLPLAASALTVEEWSAIGESAAASMSKPELVMAFGMFAYEGDPTVLADMLATAPPPARALIPLIAPRVYARRAKAVHGTRRP